MATEIGARPGGRRMATSFVAPLPHRPVLSPTVHFGGTPPRIIDAPVAFLGANLQADNETIEIAHRLQKSTKSACIDAGVVVSRSSPGMALFNSVLCDRVVSSDRQGCARICQSDRSANRIQQKVTGRVVTLFDCRQHTKLQAAMPPSLRWAFVTGAYSRMSFAPYDTNRSSFSCPHPRALGPLRS